MALSLAHFPELCLEAIFKHVPLTDLLFSVRLVCKSWYKSRRTELNKRRRLVLIVDGKCETFCDFGIHLFSNGTDLIGRVRQDDGSLLNALDSLEQIKFDTLTVPGGIQTVPFIASIPNYSNTTRLHLKLNCSYTDLIEFYDTVAVQDIPQFDDQLAAKFTALSVAHLDLVFLNRRYIATQQFCARFISRNKLELHTDLESLPMTMLAQCLSLLTQLVHLDIRLDFIPAVGRVQHEEGEEDDENDDDQPQIAQVPSVRLLILSFSNDSHTHAEQLFIPEIFPNLQVLSLLNKYSQCQDCGIGEWERFYGDENVKLELALRIAECKRLARQPFLRCANLHTIELDDGNEKTEINVNGL